MFKKPVLHYCDLKTFEYSSHQAISCFCDWHSDWNSNCQFIVISDEKKGNSQKTISAKMTMKRTVCLQPRKTLRVMIASKLWTKTREVIHLIRQVLKSPMQWRRWYQLENANKLSFFHNESFLSCNLIFFIIWENVEFLFLENIYWVDHLIHVHYLEKQKLVKILNFHFHRQSHYGFWYFTYKQGQSVIINFRLLLLEILP